MISSAFRFTVLFRLFGIFKIPMIAFLKPTILELDTKHVASKVRLRRRTRNHLGTMYFGALAVGAEATVGFYAIYLIRQSGQNISLVMKDFYAEFLKRAEGDVVFECQEGAKIERLIQAAATTKQRQTEKVEITARVPSKDNLEVARFFASVSLKVV